MGFSQASRRHLELNSTKLEHVLCSFHLPPPPQLPVPPMDIISLHVIFV